MNDKPDTTSDVSSGVTHIPFIYLVYAGMFVLTYLYGVLVLVGFLVLLGAAWLFAWYEDRRYQRLDQPIAHPSRPDLQVMSQDDESDPVDDQGRCRQCGCTPFVVDPGVTTEQQIIDFATGAKGWNENPEALVGWMPPGIYCPSGCFSIHATPVVSPNPGDSSPLISIGQIPEPVRIKFADVQRDGGSYALIYESNDGRLVKVLLRVIRSESFRRIGYRSPQLSILDPTSYEPRASRCLDWDEALPLTVQLRESMISSTAIEGGGRARAREMLKHLSSRGRA